jgi:SAM-dependent methyltransferase
MTDTRQIYQNEAERYHALVSREDHEGNLLPAILNIDPFVGKDVIELGAGTGRLTRLIAPLVGSLIISDLSMHMLSHAVSQLKEMNFDDWYACLESHNALPFAPHSTDIVIAGWSFCYAAIYVGDNWEALLERVLAQVYSILRPKGKLILIESLGTGVEIPQAPDVLRAYLGYLDQHGFNSTWIRTDYCFKDFDEAKNLTRFFFGEAPMPMHQTSEGVIVPECTGLWWKTVDHKI